MTERGQGLLSSVIRQIRRGCRPVFGVDGRCRGAEHHHPIVQIRKTSRLTVDEEDLRWAAELALNPQVDFLGTSSSAYDRNRQGIEHPRHPEPSRRMLRTPTILTRIVGTTRRMPQIDGTHGPMSQIGGADLMPRIDGTCLTCDGNGHFVILCKDANSAGGDRSGGWIRRIRHCATPVRPGSPTVNLDYRSADNSKRK